LDVIFQFMVNLHETSLIYHNNSYYSVSFVFVTLAWTFFTILSNALLRSGSNISRRSLPVRNIERSGTVNGWGRWTVWNVCKIMFTCTLQKRKKHCMIWFFIIAENLTYWCLNDLSLIRLSVEKGALKVCPRYFYSLFVTMAYYLHLKTFSLLQKIMCRNKN